MTTFRTQINFARGLARTSARGLCTTLLMTALLVQAACAPKAEAPTLETVEVGAGPTDNLRPDQDSTERALGAGGLSGQLPSAFPPELPVPASASVLGTSANSVTFATEDQAERVKAQLQRELGRAGWQQDGSTSRYQKGPRSVTITFTEKAERTTIVYRF